MKFKLGPISVASPNPEAFATWLCEHLDATKHRCCDNVQSFNVEIPDVGCFLLNRRPDVHPADHICLITPEPFEKVMEWASPVGAKMSVTSANSIIFSITGSDASIGFVKIVMTNPPRYT